MYQGHKSRAAWNVALYLFNEEPLYRLVQHSVRTSRTLNRATEKILEQLPEETPDGYRYTKPTVRAALANFKG